MKKLSFVLALLLLLGLCACGAKETPLNRPSSPPEQTPRGGETVTTAAPDDGTVAIPEEAPMRTPEPAEPIPSAPTEGTGDTEGTTELDPLPSPEPTPTVTAMPGGIDRSGSFRSDTGTALNLVADWRYISVSDDTCQLTITLSLESYSLDVGERRNNTITVNGVSYTFQTDPIEIGGGFQKTQIYVWTGQISDYDPSFTFSAVWNLQGSYSGVPMDTVEVSGSWQYPG